MRARRGESLFGEQPHLVEKRCEDGSYFQLRKGSRVQTRGLSAEFAIVEILANGSCCACARYVAAFGEGGWALAVQAAYLRGIALSNYRLLKIT